MQNKHLRPRRWGFGVRSELRAPEFVLELWPLWEIALAWSSVLENPQSTIRCEVLFTIIEFIFSHETEGCSNNSVGEIYCMCLKQQALMRRYLMIMLKKLHRSPEVTVNT